MSSLAVRVGGRTICLARPTSRALSSTARVSSNLHPLSADKVEIRRTDRPLTKPENGSLVFGRYFTDHMLQCNWDKEMGWAPPVITPFANLSLPPGCISLHYAMQCFEGMKAFRGTRDGHIRLFRPELNARRLNKSSERLTLPTFDEGEFLKCLTELVRLDKDWVPEGDGYSLYIRPTHIGTAANLGVGPSSTSLLYAILSPAGAYYGTGFKPVSLYADLKHVRAWPGGVGDAKCGGNYAPGIQPQLEALRQGCQQVLWLFGEDHKVTEVGTMNLFMFWKNEQGEDELITAPLDGTILAGVTRKSILDLAREWGEFKVTEKYFTMDQVVRAVNEGRVYEMFGSGTAATVSPVGQIKYQGSDVNIPLALGECGKLTKRCWDTIYDIQYGRVEHEWAPVIA